MNTYRKNSGFTIVELLIVIVVIGILAAITVVAYNGLSARAKATSVQSDLDNNSKLLKLYSVDYGSYPTALSGSNCPTAPTANSQYCLKLSGDNMVGSYTGNASTYALVIQNGAAVYQVTNTSGPEEVTPLAVSSPTATNVQPYSVTLGATVTSDGGSTITAEGTCWGTSANPTTNCAATGGTTTGAFTQNRTGLTPTTTYHYRGYATNAQGTAYSADATFTTTGPCFLPCQGFPHPQHHHSKGVFVN